MSPVRTTQRVLARIDANDRALFLRLALGVDAQRSVQRLWMWLTHLGGARATILWCVLSAALPSVSVGLAWRALLCLGVSHAIVQVVKRFAGRPRPSARQGLVALIAVPDRYSFPSGHACAVMSVAAVYAAAFPSLAVPLLALAMIVGCSRVVLGVHYPGDVVVGQAIALATALVGASW